LNEHHQISTFIVVGNCTDICVYQLANFLCARANAFGHDWRVIVPEDCVQTYDLPIATAEAVGATPHDGDLLHKVFLYHMALNGVEVVKGIK
jgi:nicotinamidase-related amidase